MPWKYTNFYEVSATFEEEERIKANVELKLRLGWQEEYYKALLDTIKKYPDQIVVIPTISAVLRMLEMDNLPSTLVIPKSDLKEEYEERYKARGNTKDFLDIFIGNWDGWMELLRKNKAVCVIELDKGEYLSDKIICLSGKNDRSIPISEKQAYIFNCYFQRKK